MTDRAIPSLDEIDVPLSGTMLLPMWDGFKTVHVPISDLAQWIKTAESIVPASEPLQGARVVRTSNLSVGSAMDIPWQSEVFDQGDFWSSSDPTRFTIPAGVTKVRLDGAARVEGSTSLNISLTMDKNAEAEIVGAIAFASGFGNATIQLSSGIINVTEGDYFVMNIVLSSYSSRTLVPARSFFSIQAVEVAP